MRMFILSPLYRRHRHRYKSSRRTQEVICAGSQCTAPSHDVIAVTWTVKWKSQIFAVEFRVQISPGVHSWSILVISNSNTRGTVTLRAERQSAPMSKITNDGLTRSDTVCFVAVPTWKQWASKG